MSALRQRLYTIIFEHHTPGGKAFDVALIAIILLSVLTVMLDSVASLAARYGMILLVLEWIFTVLFTIEYALRLYCAKQPGRYAFSFFGIVDLLSILPTYFSLLIPSSRFLITIRILRVLRVFRILKLVTYVGEANILGRALKASRYKIAVFIFTVLAIVVVVGAIIYLIEGEKAGFTSIPRSIYWAIVTLTTVGYGDIAPQTPLGQALAAFVMILGYGIIAVPTGIVTVELGRASHSRRKQRLCGGCGRRDHAADARFCKYCGAALTAADTADL
jgi:voltage-gated potassium channel